MGRRQTFEIAVCIAAIVLILVPGVVDAAAEPASGPLRVHPENARYFTDGSGRAVYLTGSHHWNNLQDSGEAGTKPRKFDYSGYLQLMSSNNHNFMRMWAWEGGAKWAGARNDVYDPVPYGGASSGKFDLKQFDPAYFDRLRSRVIAARDRGIYVGIMLFQGWSIYSHGYGNPWPGHPFNRTNNINGINGDPDGDGEGKECHSLRAPEVTRLQEAYVRKVIDTVNDLDNVLYEITNETADYSRDWQYHMINYIKKYQRSKPKQHPVGMTYFDSGGKGTMAALFASPADWISPGDDGGNYDYQGNPPAADGRKVIISDTDHIFGVGGDGTWVWKNFCRGLNPIFMDPLPSAPQDKWMSNTAAQREAARRAMGDTRTYADKMNLAAMTPRNELASTKYCLANPGVEYLVYQRKPGQPFSVELKAGSYQFEWFNPQQGVIVKTRRIDSSGKAQEFKAPFESEAVLYLKAQK